MTALRRRPHSGLSFFGKMSLFRCGSTVQKKIITEHPNNSDASEDLEIVEIQLQRTLSMMIMSLTMPNGTDAVSIV